MNNLMKKIVFKTKKHSPEILLVTGLVAGGATIVAACKGTTKASRILEESKDDISKIHKVHEDPGIAEEDYSEEDYKKDLTITYVKTGASLVKTYAPAMIFGTISLISILASYGILKKRHIALSSAYAALSAGFKAYRGNVVERYGAEVDKDLYFGAKEETIEVVEVDKDGKEKKVKKKTKVIDPTKSPYAVIFNASSRDWQKDSTYNDFFLQKMEDAANLRLKADGIFFLNDAYDLLDIEKTKAGQIVGWRYNPNIEGKQISFGLTEDNESYIRLRDGYEVNCWLDFNVEGNVWDYMPGE